MDPIAEWAKKPLRRMTGTIAAFARRRVVALGSMSLRIPGLIRAAAVSGILASLLVLAASAIAALYEHAKSWGTRGDV